MMMCAIIDPEGTKERQIGCSTIVRGDRGTENGIVAVIQ
jgi:hypothetical protein